MSLVEELKPSPDIVEYAIGDVHGYLGHMTAALDWCAQDAASRGLEGRVHLLGDYVDRGPQSRGVIEKLMAGSTHAHMRWLPLRGNHDHVFSATVADPGYELASEWWAHGGQQTLLSYGWNPMIHGLPRLLSDYVPEEHAAFLAALPVGRRVGERLFVHAGIKPGKPLAEQTYRDLMWIRTEFLKSKEDHGFTVVHGHSPEYENPADHGNRLALDAGCFYTGRMAVAAYDFGSPTPRLKVVTRDDFVPSEPDTPELSLSRKYEGVRSRG